MNPLWLPWREPILAGMLAYDLLGFQTVRDCDGTAMRAFVIPLTIITLAVITVRAVRMRPVAP